jgi:intein/homing endonuclease
MANPSDFLDVYSDRVWNAVTAERPAHAAAEILATADRERRDSMARTWVLEIDPEYMRNHGVTIDNIVTIISAARMTVISRSPNSLTVRLISGQFPPRLLIQRLVQAYRTRRVNAEAAATGPTGQPHGPSVTQIFRQFPVWRSVKEERHAFTDEQIANTTMADQRQIMSRRWRLIIDPTAISAQERLTNFLQGVNIPIIESTPTALVVEIPTDQSPSAYILSQVGALRPVNQPRLLNADEIRSILDAVPQVQGAVKDTSQTVRESIQLRIYEQLKTARLTPLGIPDLRDDIVNRFERSRVHPGSMVGVTAAEALGGPITQMALNSVDWHERIVVVDALNQPFVVKIGHLIDSLMSKFPDRIVHIPENRTEYLELDAPIRIPSIDEYGAASWEIVTAVTRHLPVGDLVKIKTRSGREVAATAQKSFLVYENGKIIPRNGADLKIDDWVPVTYNLADPENLITHLDLVRYLPKTEWIYGSDMLRAKHLHAAAVQPNGQVPTGWWNRNLGVTFILPYNRPDSILYSWSNTKLTTFEEGCVYPKCSHKVVSRIPEKIPLDEHFGFVVGIYLAEGWSTDTFVGISNNEPVILDRVRAWCDKYGVTHHTVVSTNERFPGSMSTDLKLHSVILARWFKPWMGTGAANKKMPPEAFIGPREFAKGILDGYFSGDGYVEANGNQIKVTSVSEELILGTIQLCQRFGIFGKKSGRQQDHNNIGSPIIQYTHEFNVSSGSARQFAHQIGSSHPMKRERLELIKTRNFVYEIGQHYEPFNNVILDPIVEIKRVPSSTPFVYDLTIPSTLNFSVEGGLTVRDTFHVSGSSKNASYGVDAMRELLNVSKKRRHESCSIYFKNPNMTYDDVYAKRSDIVGMTVADLVRDVDIDTPDNLTQYWWHTTYPAIMGRPVPTATWVMRLMLNVNVMYAYKVTMEQVVSSLELRNADVRTITVIASPLSEGIIDIYPDDRAIVQPLQEKGLFTQSYAPLTFLTQIVRQELDSIIIQGVPGIRRLFPVGVPVWKIVREVIRVFNDADVVGNPQESLMRRMWYLVLNKMQMRSSGISVPNLQRLCEACGMEIQEVTPDYLVVLMPEIPAADLERENAKPPKERRNLANPQIYVQFRLAADETETKRVEEDERKKGNRFFRRPMSELARAGIFYYADADGNNFQALLGREDVDPTHTVSNNVHENYRTLGIEAARTFMISEFITVITYDGSYINPRHITLLIDFMTNRGEPLPITFSGISRQATGTLGKASFEHAMDTFRDAAGFGTSEQIKSTSASIYVGKRAEIGTGYFDIRIDEQRIQEFQERSQAQPQAQVDESALRAMIDRLGEISFGTEHLHYEDPEQNAGFLLGEGTLPTTTMAPEVVIQEQGQLYAEPTVKAAPIISDQLLGVYPTIATAPSLPEPATAVTTTISTPVGITPTIPLRGQTTHPLVSVVTTMEMTQPPPVSAQIEAPLAPRSQPGVAVVATSAIIPAPVPPTTALNQPVPPTAGVPVPAPAPQTTQAPVPPPTAVNVAPIPPPIAETIITAGAPERQIQQARVRPIKAAAFLSSLRRGGKK